MDDQIAGSIGGGVRTEISCIDNGALHMPWFQLLPVPSCQSHKNELLNMCETRPKTGIAEPLIYYSRVGFQFVRQVGTHAKVGVPDFGAATQGISNFTSAFKNGEWKKVTVRQVGQLAAEGVVISGFFLVGEMIGKGSIIGYHIPG